MMYFSGSDPIRRLLRLPIKASVDMNVNDYPKYQVIKYSTYIINLLLLFVGIFHRLKLELLSQFPASSDKKDLLFIKNKYFSNLIIFH